MLFHYYFYGAAHSISDIHPRGAVFALSLGGNLSGKTVDIHTCHGCRFRLVSLGKERGDYSGEHIAASRSGKPGIAA